MQFKESIINIRGRFFSREKGQGSIGTEKDSAASNSSNLDSFENSSASSTLQELTSEEKLKGYFQSRCEETESFINSADTYWSTICPLLIEVNRLLADDNFDLAQKILRESIAQAKKRVADLSKNSQINDNSELKNQKIILHSLDYDLHVLDPAHVMENHLNK